MDKIKKIVIIGFGQRGQIYAGYTKKYPGRFKVAAVVDIDPEKRELASREYGCSVFADTADFFKEPVPADAAVVAVQDCDHVAVTLRCMKEGYDILLEKPIACTLEDCITLDKEAKNYKAKVVVCHVLRYTPFYSRIKQILDDGILGDIINVHASENVGYYHQAHSFVRGPWKNAAASTPMIVAKCCHDMDILRWFMDKKPLKVSSFGALTHFTEKSAPLGASSYCSECKINDCVYNAQRIYKQYPWMASYFCRDNENESAVLQALKGTEYDRCVYKSGNDVVDHQVTIIEFENGATACHTMTAFSKEIYRDIKIHGTKGELVGVMEDNFFEVRPFGGEVYRVDSYPGDYYGNHGGGDEKLMDKFYSILCDGENVGASFLDVSIDSHRMAFGAEKSRVSGKTVVL